MDIKVLIGILGRPWMIEPKAAQHWGSVVDKMISTGSAPLFDKRRVYQDGIDGDFGDIFNVDESGNVSKAGPIQVFKVHGPVAKEDYCGTVGSRTWTQHIEAANADPGISAIILWIDSPGGQVDGTETLANTVKNSRKPVIAFADGMMASAAYWIGSSAQMVIADNANNGWNTEIGSIGTMATYYDDRGALEKEGYKRHLIFADASSDKWGDWFKAIDGDYSDVKKVLNGINDTFLSAVKSNRAGKLSSEENVLTGKVYNAKDALKYGLVDKLGDFGTAVKAAANAGREYKKYNRTKNDKMQNVLIAANAEAFQPVAKGETIADGGFLLQEDQLNAIDAKLAENATIIRNMTTTNEQLQAQVAAAGDAEAVQAQLDEANTQLATLKEQNEQLTTQLAEAQKGAGMFLNEGNPGGQDPKGVHEGGRQEEPAHVREAREMLPPVPTKKD